MEEKTIQDISELLPGTGLCGGKYVIEKKIGEGGFGITYRAVQSGLNRAVCIKEYFLAGRCVRDVQAKTIHIQGTGEDVFEKYRKAFVKEAQTLAALHHPGIVEVIDIFDENNTSYMVMPFIEGRSLQSIVEKNGPITYPEAVNYMAQIASAVGYIHERHILHRDIKPDNIMITADYKAVLIDFGSAREFEEDKTQAHTSMVTHGYAPTEQYSRNSRKGSYTDIYAIGATLYFILTGQVPLEAAARITETMPEPKELNPDLPEEANRTIMKAMQLKSQDRHQSIAEFMDDLRNVTPSAPAKENPDIVQDKTESVGSGNSPDAKVLDKVENGSPAKRKPTLPIIAVSVVVLLSVYFVFFHKTNHQREAQKSVAHYNETVARCHGLINDGNERNTQALLDAKILLDSVIRPMDSCYGDAYPDVYKRSLDIQNLLYPKLSAAAESWATYANKVMQLGDYRAAIKNYELSLSLWEDQGVREDYYYAVKKLKGQKKRKTSEGEPRDEDDPLYGQLNNIIEELERQGGELDEMLH